MNNPRDEVLERIRAALPKAVLPTPPEPAADPVFSGRGEDLVAIFTREAVAVGAIMHGPVPLEDVPECVTSILRGVGAKRLLAWAPAEMGVPGLSAVLKDRGFEILDPRLPSDRRARTERLLRLEEAAAGLTGADMGLAETGTLVLRSGPGRPRLACLLPPVHVALLPLRRILPSLSCFLADAAEAAVACAGIVLVSGPSRTGDIELTLAQGMHGPREVHIVLVG